MVSASRNEMMQSLARRLKTLRLGLGLSMEQLAARAGIGHAIISRVEAGTRDPAFTTIIKLARAMEVPLSELMPTESYLNTEGASA